MDHFLKSICLTIAASLLAACASAPDRNADDWQGAGGSVQVMEYSVQPGDSLAGIARRLTGNIENWKTIAEFNEIADPSIIQVNDIILIPAELLPADQQGFASRTVPVEIVFETNQAEAADQAQENSAVFQRSALPGEPQVDVTTWPVVINKTFIVSRSANTAAQSTLTGPVLIQVTGTDKPKGIYAQPFNHSPLLMRAEPGTTFPLDQRLGDWLRINTDKGAGYIRSRDAKMIGASYNTTVSSDNATG
ncbi:MAG: LysM peptidoglycan-binding domain-containing protein [Granulosicoccus sp.]|nr:LysM peptidoglycan-binding domain-containing protein [Granulosicoccus sp.]